MFRVLLLSLNRDQKRLGLSTRLEQIELKYSERLLRNIRLMELRRVLNFSTRYSVGVEDFLIQLDKWTAWRQWSSQNPPCLANRITFSPASLVSSYVSSASVDENYTYCRIPRPRMSNISENHFGSSLQVSSSFDWPVHSFLWVFTIFTYFPTTTRSLPVARDLHILRLPLMHL